MSRAVVAELLRRRLNALGIRQADLADQLGVDAATVNRWLNGGSLPHAKSITRLAETLQIDENELLRAVNTAQRDDNKKVRRENADLRKQYEATLAEFRQIVVENRDINREIGEVNRRNGENIAKLAEVMADMVSMLADIRDALSRQPGRQGNP